MTVFLCCLEQSQFRFDNECTLSLPDNHKRVSGDLHVSPYMTVGEMENPELRNALLCPVSMLDETSKSVSMFTFSSYTTTGERFLQTCFQM